MLVITIFSTSPHCRATVSSSSLKVPVQVIVDPEVLKNMVIHINLLPLFKIYKRKQMETHKDNNNQNLVHGDDNRSKNKHNIKK